MFTYNSKSVKNRATAVVFSVNYVDCVVEMQRNGGREEWYFVSKIVLTYFEKKIVLVIKIFLQILSLQP